MVPGGGSANFTNMTLVNIVKHYLLISFHILLNTFAFTHTIRKCKNQYKYANCVKSWKDENNYNYCFLNVFLKIVRVGHKVNERTAVIAVKNCNQMFSSDLSNFNILFSDLEPFFHAQINRSVQAERDVLHIHRKL